MTDSNKQIEDMIEEFENKKLILENCISALKGLKINEPNINISTLNNEEEFDYTHR